MLALLVLLALGAPRRADADAPTQTQTQWVEVGPHNILNAVDGLGEAGTCADAVSPASDVNTIYVGGSNNGAASGVYATVDGGRNWASRNVGLSDGRIFGLFLDPGDDGALFAGTPSGLFNSFDAGLQWTFASESAPWGLGHNFYRALLGGRAYALCSVGAGIAYRPLAGAGGGPSAAWSLFARPAGTGGLYMISLAPAYNATHAIVYTTLGDVVYRAVIGDDGGGMRAEWTGFPMRGNTVTVDPSDINHVLSTEPGNYTVMESHDGGQTVAPLGNRGLPWYISFDPQNKGVVWAAGQGFYMRSTDSGKTFSGQTHWKSVSANGFTIDAAGFDFQRLIFGVGEFGAATCTDQGLYIYTGPNNNTLRSANGQGMSLGIAISPAIANGSSNIMSTFWDRGPTASWDGGLTWPATTWYGTQFWHSLGDAGCPCNVGEGGAAVTLGDGGMHVFIYHHDYRVWASAQGGTDFQEIHIASNMSTYGFDYARTAAGQASGPAYLLVHEKAANGTTFQVRPAHECM